MKLLLGILKHFVLTFMNAVLIRLWCGIEICEMAGWAKVVSQKVFHENGIK